MEPYDSSVNLCRQLLVRGSLVFNTLVTLGSHPHIVAALQSDKKPTKVLTVGDW